MRRIRTWWRSFFLTPRFFWIATGIVFLFCLAFAFPVWMAIAQVLLVLFGAALLADLFLLYGQKSHVEAERQFSSRMSNGDENKVQVKLSSSFGRSMRAEVLDEAPEAFQLRDLHFHTQLQPGTNRLLRYWIRPIERGQYLFGWLHVLIYGPLGLAQRRFSAQSQQELQVYPSYIQMRKYDLRAISQHLRELGIKQVRQRGTSLEYDHLREYVQGDDVRHINWKATARRNELMINHFEDEKSQQVISLIDKGRVMEMPFNGMALLDYAINTALVISNIAHQKHDKPGLITFNREIEDTVAPSRSPKQMGTIMETLYNQHTSFDETSFDQVYTEVFQLIKRRSLFLLFSNFETLGNLERQLDYLKIMARKHVLVLFFFRNTELEALAQQAAKTERAIYRKVAAQKFLLEKERIVKRLNSYGIFTVLSRPEELTVHTINQYLLLKARGVI